MTQAAAPVSPQKQHRPAPDHANVRYGPHERNVLDFWRSRTQASAAPLVVEIHGGGFRQGDKSDLRTTLLNAGLDAGFAFASINYRLSHQAPFPAQMHDGARAIQFLRTQATEWRLDPQRIAATGGSAGAGLSLWLAFHPDLADPKSPDPIERQSTKVCVAGSVNGQCSYDPRFYKKIGLTPATDHPFMLPFYGLTWDEIDRLTPRAVKLFDEAAPINFVTPGAAPVFMVYDRPNDPVPGDVKAWRPTEVVEYPKVPQGDPVAGRAIHHPHIGEVLKEKLDSLGIEAELHLVPAGHIGDKDPAMIAFFKRHFARV